MRIGARILISFLMWAAFSVHAATFNVTSSADSGAGTLRQAILDANATAGLHQIRFQTNVNLTAELPALTSPVDLDGLISPGVRAVVSASLADGTTFRFSPGSNGTTVRNLEVNAFSRSVVVDAGTGDITFNGNRLHHASISSGLFIRFGTTTGEGNIIDELRFDGGSSRAYRNTVTTILVDGGGPHYIGDDAGNGNQVSGRISAVNATNTVHIEGNTVIRATSDTMGILADNPSPGAPTLISQNIVDGYDVGIHTRSWSQMEANTVRNNSIGIELGASSFGSAAGTVIGGRSSTANTIHGNSVAGVRLTDAAVNNVWILTNSIFDNGIAIDLGTDGPTPNDPAPDADTGPNDLQNYPVLTSAGHFPTGVIVRGSLTSLPLQHYSIEFFSNPAGDPEARTFLRELQIDTDATGTREFQFNVGMTPLPTDIITATATIMGPPPFQGSTSEVSPAVEVTQPGMFAFAVSTTTVSEGETAQVFVQRIGGSEGTVTVPYTMANGTAVAPGDYTAATGTLTFGPGVTEQTISIPILEDGFGEPAEFFWIGMDSPTGGAIIDDTRRSHQVIIAQHGAGIPTASTWALIALGVGLAVVTMLRLRS